LFLQEGICEGPVLFHKHKTKTDEEVAESAARWQERIDAKEGRKKEQEANVAKKRAAKDDKTSRRKRRKGEAAEAAAEGAEKGSDAEGGDSDEEGGDAFDGDASDEYEEGAEDEGPTDAEWYQKEVGEAPEEGMFRSVKKQAKKSKEDDATSKKHKMARKANRVQQ